ncbi:alpha-1-antitrypsin-like [Hyperolius riggenbachi]|uniref:alpha-1-antitrypsin-like n=1 Tax=Hyperolius riggenbachi TaxID=752182 RepID=UPI0035A2E651
MRVLLYLGLSTALLLSLVFADHHGDHGEQGGHKDCHGKKGEKGDRHHHDHHHGHHHHDHHHHHHGHHHHHHHHHHSNENLDIYKIAPGNAKFAFDLFREVAAEHPSENIAFSPLSISVAFALLSLGARAKTCDQILEGIGFNISQISEKEIHDGFHHLLEELNDDDSELSLDTGNGLFISKAWKILDQFLNDTKELFDSEAFSVDYQDNEAVKKLINEYVNKNTNGMIPEVLDSVEKETALILVNYIYFKGKWEVPFQEQRTQSGDFHVSDTETVKVPFMSKTGSYKVAYLDDATLVSLPYKGNASALFILPTVGKLQDVEANLKDIVKRFKKKNENTFLRLNIPKFSVEGSLDLKSILPKFGINDLFSNNADLSGITGAPDLKISKAIHKAKIQVDESGTEAAGTTVIEAVRFSMVLRSLTFDRPFIFAIYSHSTRSTLFLAKIANPAK